LTNKIQELSLKHDILVKQKNDLKDKKKTLENQIDRKEKAAEAFKKAVDYFYEKSIKTLETTVTYGLQEVFDDRDLTVKAEIEEKRGMIQLELITIDNEQGIQGRARNSFGGAVVQVQAALVLIVVMILLNSRKFVILDEKFSNVSKEYQANVGKVLKELCEKFGFNILLVTHNKEILDYADKIYTAKIDDGKLNLIETKR
jgi:ABC-type dipeptide/oligopeptide/nickel transport system ATPase subunit